MVVQYVVGLCCLRRHPDAVDITVGDMVHDAAASKDRDVDITVTLEEADGAVRAFKAYEVKREGEPLDVASIEQLCMKLRDMPKVTHRAVVSASGFTDGAIAKATAHSVDLFVLKPWKPEGQDAPSVAHAPRISSFSSHLLCWVDWSVHLLAPNGPQSFTYNDAAPLFRHDGAAHGLFGDLAKLLDALLLRSTEILFLLEPAQTIARAFPLEPVADNDSLEVGPAWPHTHTLDVTRDEVFLAFGDRLAQLRSVTISGRLQWQRRRPPLECHILEDVSRREPFAGAALAEWGSPDGRMFAWVFAPGSRTVGIHTIQLEPRHRNAIRKLKIPLPRRG
jgi:hypothetical protein